MRRLPSVAGLTVGKRLKEVESACVGGERDEFTRVFGRRFRVAPLFLVVSALMLAGGARLQAVALQWGGPGAHPASLAAVVAGELPGDAGVAMEVGRVGGAGRGGAAGLSARRHPRPQRSLAAVAQPDLAVAVDRLLRAWRWAGAVRREWFFSRRVGGF